MATAPEKDKKGWLAELKAIPFPFDGIVIEFAADPTKNLRFDDAFIDELLKTQYESPDAYLILGSFIPNWIILTRIRTKIIYTMPVFSETVKRIRRRYLLPTKIFMQIRKTGTVF